MKANTKQFIAAINAEFPQFAKNIIPYAGEVKEDDHVACIIARIYNNGVEDGIKFGKREKINEIKQVLEINIED